MSRDGWVKRQKEVQDLSTTRLREGDSVLAVLAGQHARHVRLLHATSARPTRARIIDVPASTGYGEPIQKLFKLQDGERVVAALSLDPRVVGQTSRRRKKAGRRAAAGPRHRRHERRLQPALRPRAVRRAEHARRDAATRGRPRASKWSAWRSITGKEMIIAATPEARGTAVPGRRGQLPVRARARA